MCKEEKKEKDEEASIIYENKQSTVHPFSHGDPH
jgi:hypothetical protein